MMTRLTRAEVVNLVTVLLRRGYTSLQRATDFPSPGLVRQVLLDAANHGRSVGEVVASTMLVAETELRIQLSDRDFERMKSYLHRVAADFMKLPEADRNRTAFEDVDIETRH